MRSKKEIEKKKKESETMLKLMTILTEGTPQEYRTKYYAKQNNFYNILVDLGFNESIKEEQFKELINIVEQFENVINSYIKENKIKV